VFKHVDLRYLGPTYRLSIELDIYIITYRLGNHEAMRKKKELEYDVKVYYISMNVKPLHTYKVRFVKRLSRYM